MTEPLDSVILHIPARIADLAFRIGVPRDWNSLELPAEEVDFSSPGAFFPLMLVAAPWAAVVLTVAARPGFEDGTLQDWSLFLLDSQEVRPTSFGPAMIGNVQGLAGVGRQQQDGTWLEMRFAFFEDGGRLVLMGLLAPEAISGPLDAVWKTALGTFVLERPQGQSVPLGPGVGISPEPVVKAGTDALPAAEVDAAHSITETAAAEANESPQPAQFTESDLGYYAKSENSNTFDPEHPVNARLRDQGVGLVPKLIETDADARAVKLGAGGIRALIRVAFGWHVIDDGKRTIVLDPDGKVQISLNVIPKEGRSIEQILDDLQAEATESYPDREFLRLQDGGIWGLAIRGILVDGEPIEQIHMLTAWADESAMLRARVTADPPSVRLAANYTELILKSVDYGAPDRPPGGPDAPSKPSLQAEPEWMQRAQELEREERLEEAERLIRKSVPTLDFAIATAEFYRQRWLRLRESDPSGARDARKQAANWAGAYASYATSGGEGVALSHERDEFLRLLGPEPLE